jgi:hypothetical protein
MAELGPKQREKFNKIRRNQGIEAAREYRQGIIGRKSDASSEQNLQQAPTTQPISPNASQRIPLDINNVNDVLNAQESANLEATRGSTPNITTTGGSRTVTYDENGQPQINEKLSPEQQALYQQRAGIMGDINNQFGQYGKQIQQQGQFDPRANNPFSLNTDFSGMQERVYGDTLARYERDMNPQIEQEKQAMAQSLADRGIPLGSEVYTREMNRFEDNVRQSREDVRSRAYQDSIGAASSAFQNQMAGNQQVFGQNLTSYQMPFDRYQGLMGAAGQYDRPDLGAVQSIQTRPVDYAGLSANYRGQDIQQDQFGQTFGQQGEQFNKTLQQQMEIAKMNNSTSRANAGAGRTDPFAYLNAQTQSKKDLMAYEAGLNAGRAPQQQSTSWGDVAGSTLGGLLGGFAQSQRG